MTNSEMERKLEEVRTKQVFKQGEARSTPRMMEDQVIWILVMITTVTNESQVEVKKHLTRYFHQVKGLLQSLMNDILEKVPHMDVLHVEYCNFKGYYKCISLM